MISLEHLCPLLFFLQIVGDIAAVLPPYTLQSLQEKQDRLGRREELFGKKIKFVPLTRDKIVFPDVSELNDIALRNENVQNGDLVEDWESNSNNESEQQQFSGKS
jgi:hypothetical protein